MHERPAVRKINRICLLLLIISVKKQRRLWAWVCNPPNKLQSLPRFFFLKNKTLRVSVTSRELRMHLRMFLVPRTALIIWSACLLCTRFSVCVVVSRPGSYVLTSFLLAWQLFSVDNRCYFSLSFLVFHLGIGLILYDSFLSVCVSVGFIHPTLAEAKCVCSLYLYSLDIYYVTNE